jgi:hypothetical protein
MNKHQNISISLVLLSILLFALCNGCKEEQNSCYDLLSYRDTTPPVFINLEAESPTCFKLSFNEKLSVEKDPLLYLNKKPHDNFTFSQKDLYLYTTNQILPGQKVNISGRVRDLAGNTTSFNCTAYGTNPNPATLLINEFTTKGTSKSPDRVELVAIKSGCIAGITLYDGVVPYYTDCCILPNQTISTGEYIVITFKENPDNSYYESENHAGLSSNNGCLTLCSDPSARAHVIDAVVYSNKTATTFQGFGSHNVLNGAQLLAQNGKWQYAEQLSTSAIDCSTATATRSINRRHTSSGLCVDTNSQSDWYVTKTGGQSFGSANSKERY